MDSQFFGLLALYLILLLGLAPVLGRYIRRAMEDGRYAATAWGRWAERLFYRAAGVDPGREMHWRQYAVAVLLFNVLGLAAVYALQRLQGSLPLNPAGMGAVSPDSAFNTAISFVANTNWQGYAGESTMSYLTQMLALTVQNFLSAATGICVLFALIRGLARHGSATVGNFWVDVTRSTLYVLLPLALALALALVSQGVIQNTSAYQEAATLQAQPYGAPRLDANGQALNDAAGKPLTDPAIARTQTLAMGRWPRRKPSRCWAPMAAVSSTPTRPIPTKTRRRCPICWRCWPSSSFPPRCASASGRWWAAGARVSPSWRP